MIEKGDVFSNVEGRSVEEVYNNICKEMKLPDYIEGEKLKEELLLRENVLSTAIGRGIAIPHPRRPLIKNEEEKRIFVCYLKNSLDMSAPDDRRISILFVLLSNSTSVHIKSLSELAKMFKNNEFIDFIKSRPSKHSLIEKIKNMQLISDL